MNQLTLMGNLGKDAWLNQQGDCLQFSIATTESWKDKDGNWQDKVDWHLCKIYDKRKEKLLGKLKKGKRILITGKQRNNSSKLEDGSWKNYSFVSVNEIKVLDKEDSVQTFTVDEIPF